MRNRGFNGLTGFRRLIIILVLGIWGILFTAWVTKPPELPSDVIIIRPLPEGKNPYQREYDEMLKPAVMITTITGRGTGVIIPGSLVHQSISSTGTYILTAAHVVGKYSSVDVTFYDYSHQDTETLRASIVLTDTGKDLALIRVIRNIGDIRVKDIYSAKLAPKDYTPYLFAPVWAVGCSLGLPPRPSFGHLCAFAVDSWEVSAPILPGNSGGGVFAKRTDVPSQDGNRSTYELIGIAVWVRLYQDQLVTTMAGVVPIGEIYRFLDGVPGFKGSNVQKRTIEPLND
ncbi:MAG: trypsin-like peptidase domain-containing protein [Planctomycetes bacterium]|nr:trypsin-like peptidase domain-containing protein [Planctomycetota bacterium]